MTEGDIVIIRSRAHRVVGFTPDGEPRLVRVEPPRRGGYLDPL